MPIANVTLSNGETFEFFVREGITNEEVSEQAPFAYSLAKMGVDVMASPPPPKRTLSGHVGEVVKGVPAGALNLLESAATGASFLLPEKQEQAARGAIAKVGAAVQKPFTPKSGYEDTIPRKLAEGVGSTVPFIGAAALSLPFKAAGTALGAASGAGIAAERAVAAGATEEQISQAAGAGIVPGAAEMLSPLAFMKRFKPLRQAFGDDIATNIVARLKRIGQSAGEEALQEAASEVAQNMIAKGIYNPEQGVFAGSGESAGYGGGVGGLVQALFELALPNRSRGTSMPQDQLDLIPEDTENFKQATQGPPAPVTPMLPTVNPDGQLDMFGVGPEEASIIKQAGDFIETGQLDMFDTLRMQDEQTRLQEFAATQKQIKLIDEKLQAEQDAANAARIADEKKKKDEIDAAFAAREEERIALEKVNTPAPRNTVMANAFAKAKQEKVVLPPKEQMTTATLDAFGISKGSGFYQKIKNVAPRNMDDADIRASTEAELNSYRFKPEVKEKIANYFERLRTGYTPEQWEHARAVAAKPRIDAQREAWNKQRAAADEARSIEEQAALVEQERVAGLQTDGRANRGASLGTESPKLVQSMLDITKPVGIANDEIVYEKLSLNKLAGDGPKAAAFYLNKYGTAVGLRLMAFDAAVVGSKKSSHAVGWVKANLQPDAIESVEDMKEQFIEMERRGKEAAEKLAAKEPTPLTEAQKAAVTKQKTEKAEMDAANRRTRMEDRKNEREMKRGKDQESAMQEAVTKKAAEDKRRADEAIGIYGPSEEFSNDPAVRQKQLDRQIKIARKNGINIEHLPAAVEHVDRTVTAKANKSRSPEYLIAEAVVASVSNVSSGVMDKITVGDLKGALEQLAAEINNSTLSRMAKKLASRLGDTTIEVVSNLTNTQGELVAGLFDPATNTIRVTPKNGLSAHTLLHEVAHALTSHVIAEGKTTEAKQIIALFNEIKNLLPSEYGAQSPDEFASEVMSNPKFRNELAKIPHKDATLFQRLLHLLSNLFRRLTGAEVKGPMLTEADEIIELILSPSPETRNAAKLYAEAIQGKPVGWAEVKDAMSGAFSAADSTGLGKRIKDMGRQAREQALRLAPLFSVAGWVKTELPAATKLFDELMNISGARHKAMNQISDTARQLLSRFKGESAHTQRQLFNDLIAETRTAGTDDAGIGLGVDPDKGGSRAAGLDYYQKFWLNYGQDVNGKFVEKEESFNTKEARDKRHKDLKDQGIKATKRGGNKEQTARFEYLYDKYFKHMTPDTKRAYRTLRDANAAFLERVRTTVEARVDSMTTDKGVRYNLKNLILTQFLSKANLDPYFTLYREGDYWLDAYEIEPRTGKLELYKRTFKNAGERQQHVARLKEDKVRTEAIAKAEAQQKKLRDDAGGPVREGSRGASKSKGVSMADIVEYHSDDRVQSFKNATKDMGTGTAYQLMNMLKEAKVAREVQDNMVKFLLSTMPENSLARQLGQTRSGVLGFEEDAIEAFRKRMPLSMVQLVNLEHDTNLNNIEAELSEQYARFNDAGDPADKSFVTSVYKLLANKENGYIKFARNPRLADWSRNLKSGVFAYTLGANVSSVLMNSTNLPIVVFPHLSGIHGLVPTMKAMWNAARVFLATPARRASVGVGEVTDGDVWDGWSIANWLSDPSKVPPEFKKYIPLAKQLQVTGEAPVVSIFDTIDVDNPTNKTMQWFHVVSGFLFAHGERFNRQITAMATYDLELARLAKVNKTTEENLNPKQVEEAIRAALGTVQRTNAGMAIETAPTISQNDIGSVVWMYKRFGTTMMLHQAATAKQFWDNRHPERARAKVLADGDTPEEAAKAYEETKAALHEAKRQLMYMYGMAGTLAGVGGVPLYGMVQLAMDMLFLDDEDEDFNTMVSNAIGEGAFSGALQDIFNVDVSTRIGMTNLLWRAQPNVDKSLSMQAVEQLGGPAFGIAQRVVDGVDLLGEGEYQRAFEKMLPAGIANPLKAFRYHNEGASTMRGDPIVGEMHWGSEVAQFFGLAPAQYTRRLERNAMEKRIERSIIARKTDLMRDYYMAMRNQDVETMSKKLTEMAEFNQDNPLVAITPKTLQRSLAQHRRTSQMAEQLHGITLNRRLYMARLQKMMEDMGDDF